MPPLPQTKFFHSKALMQIYELTARHKPYVVVARNEQGLVLAHLMAVVRNGKCRIFGEGEYNEQLISSIPETTEDIFASMLAALEKKVRHRTLYVEVSDLNRKMFAYRQFKDCGFFPIHWLQVRNSLHSRHPKERLSRKIIRRIAYARKMGVTTTIVSDEQQLSSFYTTIRTYYNFHLRKFCPEKNFFRQLMLSGNATLYLSFYKEKTVAACAVAYSDGNAYLWFGAYKNKSHPRLSPAIITIWNILCHCHSQGTQHFCFMDVGLPFIRNAYYDSILDFGGKSIGTYRWFRFHNPLLHALIRHLFSAH